MALDGIFLRSIVNELQTFIGCRIDKINQPEKDEIILSIRQNRKNKKLLISSSSNYPRIHITEMQKTNPQIPPSFCMILRKYIESSHIMSISQIENDRIVNIELSCKDDMGYDSLYSLIIEIMGRHSNISLIRNSDNKIMDSIKHLTPDMNSYRSLFPGISYTYPPANKKLNPFGFSFEAFNEYIDNNNILYNEKFFSSIFNGISAVFSKSFYDCYPNLSLCNRNDTFDKINIYLSSFKENKYKFILFYKNDLAKDFYCNDIYFDDIYSKEDYPTASLVLESYYYKKDVQDRISTKSSDLLKFINTNLDRCYKKIKILNNAINDNENMKNFQLFGELLTANIYRIDEGMKSIDLENYYDNNKTVTIDLDPNKSPSFNIQKYFKKYNKIKKSIEQALIQLEKNQSETEYLESVLSNIKNALTYEDIDEIREELIQQRYLKPKKNTKNKKIPKGTPYHIKSIDGFDIYIGKNNLQNDFLTTKFASKNDLWFHAKGIPGSHVILKYDKNLTDNAIEEAASYAAFFSKGKESPKVEVDYTHIKNIKKIAGSKPGMVLYHTNYSMLVIPKSL